MASQKEQYKAIAENTAKIAQDIGKLLEQFPEEVCLDRTMQRLLEANDSLRVIRAVLDTNLEILVKGRDTTVEKNGIGIEE
ncbi:Uncharacterised protein [Ectopseudomonas mendocina]|uniref:Uncharacterized protein n=1 Tax=Ectopseudomonas mendocina TaxID=300 RepID=A0A379PLB3_ECTME|nr:hypothetical protein [Pseudomonas mendocina]SUE95761.1 Uncharacterised protein [Pseudomonas mendocina]